MSNTPRTLLLALVLVGLAAPALADTSFSFVSVEPGYRERPWHHRHHGDWYRPRPYAPVFYAPAPPIYVAPPPRTVVYATTVVRPAPQIVDYGMPADQASPTYRDGSGRLCREYQSSGYVGGSRAPMYGTACLQPDGSWRVMD